MPLRAQWRRVFAMVVLATGWIGTANGPANGTAVAAGADVGPPVRAGDAVVVGAKGGSKPIIGGGSAERFIVRLPDGAVCPGDTMTDDWRLQSFVIPAADDPAALAYGVIGPTGATQYALYPVDTRPFANAFVPAKSNPDDPALVGALPPFTFEIFPPGTLPDGRYRIGVACTYFRQTATYWDTEIMVTNTPDDEPAHFTWRVVDPPTDSSSAGGTSPWIFGAGAVVFAVLAAIGVGLARDRASRLTPLAKEHS